MTTSKSSKRGSGEAKIRQKRKKVDDLDVEKDSSLKSPKKSRKDDHSKTQSTKPPSKLKNPSQPNQPPEKKITKIPPKKLASNKKSSETELEEELEEKSVVSVEGSNEASEDGGEEEEGNYHLIGFSSEEDSSDEEIDQTTASVDASKLPSLAKEDVALKKRLDEANAKSKKNQSEERGVIYLGRIPHGFYEDEMRKYFSQFGDVTRLRLSRNKKTGHSKHYAFIEFSSADVAQIVSETMHNYLLVGHILQCRVIPKDQVHPELWVGANRKWRLIPRDKIVREQHNKLRTLEEQERSDKALLGRQAKKLKKIKEKGIDYDFEAVAYKRPIETS